MKRILFTILAVIVVLSAKAQKADTLKGPDADTTIYVSVEHEPEFPGGINKFLRYLASNIKYPPDARAHNIQGRVIVSMVVEKDGTISNVKIARSVSDDIDKEAMRALYQLPKWKPGIQHGKPVRVFYSMPINFPLPGK